MNIPSALGGWDVHTHIIPPAVIAAGAQGRYGMGAGPETLHICQHGVPLHPLSEVNVLVDRIASDGLDGAIVSVPPPLFRPDLGSTDRAGYAQMVNDDLAFLGSATKQKIRKTNAETVFGTRLSVHRHTHAT